MRLFEGYEAEGRFRGIKTLFVEGKVDYQTILGALHTAYGQIYFGASGCSEVDWDVLGKCLYILPVVTVELSQDNLPSSMMILNHTFLHPIINIQKFDKFTLQELLQNTVNEKIQVKFDTGTHTYVAPLRSFILNYKSDLKADKELWRQQ